MAIRKPKTRQKLPIVIELDGAGGNWFQVLKEIAPLLRVLEFDSSKVFKESLNRDYESNLAWIESNLGEYVVFETKNESLIKSIHDKTVGFKMAQSLANTRTGLYDF